jgi:hypothetical protein
MSGTGMTDFQGMTEEADDYAARATDAAINSLAPAQKAAIERKCDLCAAFSFPRHNFLDMLQMGLKRLQALLDAQGLV